MCDEQVSDYNTDVQPQSRLETEDERRFSIYFKVNNHSPQKVDNLKVQEYIKLKYKVFNENAIQYCQENLTNENETIVSLFRSIDDVDYEAIPLNKNNKQNAATEQHIEENAVTKQHIEENAETEQHIEENAATGHNTEKNALTVSATEEQVEICQEQGQIRQEQVRISSTKKLESKCSPIWQHVKQIKERNVLICNYCSKEFKDCKNTSNMLKHLSNQHPMFFYSTKKKGAACNTVKLKRVAKSHLSPPKTKRINYGIKDSFQNVTAFQDGGTKSDKITNLILFMICKDLRPISIVENEGFTTFLKYLAPLYCIPSRKTLITKMEARYEAVKLKIADEINDIDYYCVTCDNWSDCSKQSYMGVTLHYLDKKKFVMKSVCLACIPMDDRHTAENLEKHLQTVFTHFNVKNEKIVALVSDGEAAMQKACISIVGKEKHIWCFAHICARLLPDALKNLQEVNDLLTKVKTVVTLIRQSIPATNKLKELQLKDGKTSGEILNLILDANTRWYTKIDMIERYLLLEKYIYVSISECDNPIDILNREELKILNDIFCVMEPIRCIIKELSGELYSTCSIVIPLINCLNNKLNNLKLETEIGLKLKDNLLKAVAKRLSQSEHLSLLAIATILDPRFKKIHFTDPMAFAKGYTKINNYLIDKTKIKKTEVISVNKSSDSLWDFHDNLVVEASEINRSSSFDKSFELQQYLKLPRIPRTDNVYIYWKSVQSTLPVLSEIAFKYLSILASTVASERLFLRAGIIKDDSRNRLTGCLSMFSTIK